MTYLEGKPIADGIKKTLKGEVAKFSRSLRFSIVMVGDNAVSEKFVKLKEKFASDIGVETRRYNFDKNISTSELRARMKNIVHEPRNSGVIVQLPLPPHIDSQSVLNSIIPEKDADVLSARAVGNFQVGKSRVMPPVAAAVKALFEHYKIDARGKHVAILGYGRLVGQPLAVLFARIGATTTVITGKEKFDAFADIVISGIGKPKFLTADCIKDGAIVVDVGSSECEGKIVGDVDIGSVSKKASFMTPPTGGVGPLTVAMVFKNLVTLARN